MSSDYSIFYFLSRGTIQFNCPDTEYIPNEDCVKIRREDIYSWDFTRQSLENAYGHILGLLGYIPEDEALYGNAKDTLLSDIISYSAQQWFPGTNIGNIAVQTDVLSKAGSRCIKMTRNQQEAVLVVERSKQTWRASQLFKADNDKVADLVHPLREVATDCIHAETRYGLIHSMEGFVVICICRGEDDSVAIRMKLISRDDDDWTIDLASWYLAMLALNEDHRAIKLCKETPLLNNWRRVGEKRKNIYVEHPISRRRFRHLKDIPGDIELV